VPALGDAAFDIEPFTRNRSPQIRTPAPPLVSRIRTLAIWRLSGLLHAKFKELFTEAATYYFVKICGEEE